MANKSQRGRGRGNGGRGRGRSGGGGGRGRNRSLQPTSFGFVYPLTDSSYNIDDGADFKLYGQFDDSEDSDIEFNSKHSKRKAKIKKQQLNRSQRNESDNIATGISSTQFTDISDTSKHFIRSENTLNDPTQNNLSTSSSPTATVAVKKTTDTKTTYKLTNEDIIDDDDYSENDNDDGDHDDINENVEERDIDLNNLHQDIDDFDVDEEAINRLMQETSLMAETKTSAIATTSAAHIKKANIQKDDNPILSNINDNNNDNINNNNDHSYKKTLNKNEYYHQKKNQHQFEPSSSSATTTDDPYEFEISEDDLECDTDVMQDYIENVSLDDDEIELILNRNYNHFNLDEDTDDEDEDAILSFALEKQYLKELELYGYDVENDEVDVPDINDYDLDVLDALENLDNEILARSGPFLNGNDYDYDDDEVSPEMFRISLEEALAAVPPGLKPGVRNWLSHEKKEQKKQKRLEKKQKRKESKEKNKSKKNKDTDPTVQLRKIDSRLQDFIMDDQIQSLHFAPMPKNCRRQLHLLASAYNLKSHSTGSGASRTPIVTKTDRTFLPPDRRYIERFIEDAQSTLNSQNNVLRKHRMDNNSDNNNSNHGRRRNNKNNNASSSSSSSKKKDKKKEKSQKSFDKNNQQNENNTSPGKKLHGTVVASDAAPIDENNVGHRMLAAMGWRQGTGLGSTRDGITAPIEAVIRGNRRGLGT